MNDNANIPKALTIVDIDASMLSVNRSQLNSHILLLCRQGSITLDVNMVKITVEAGSRAFLSSVMTIQKIDVSDDFRATLLMIDNKLFIDATVGVASELLFSIMARPQQRVADARDRALIDSLVNSMRTLSDGNLTARLRRLTAVNLLRTIFFALAATSDNSDTQNKRYSTTDSYFFNFIALVFREVNRKHDVKYYAEALHLSPKYLNEIVKRKSGHKAKEIISNMLLTRIKHDIINSDKSLKTLADEYNFADQSSLGKFFRNMTGLSPNNFRNSSE